jgi:FKBP-type peptidyl-prolyl cis-trans isomerase FklB
MRPYAAACALIAFAALAAGCGQKPEGEGSLMSGYAEKTEKAAADAKAGNLKAAEDFQAKNKAAAGVTVTASGLQYAVIASGPATGAKPSADSVVQVNYEGKLLDGRVFDSSFERGQAAEFRVSDLVPAWVEALQLMRPGDEWTIWVPPGLGYGDQGMPPGCGEGGAACEIPPNSLLVFRMRLEKIVAGPGSAAAGAGAEAGKGETR